MLLDQKLNPPTKLGQSKYGETALMITCENGHTDCVKILLINGADSNIPNNYGITALMKACRYGHKDSINLIEDFELFLSPFFACEKESPRRPIKSGFQRGCVICINNFVMIDWLVIKLNHAEKYG